MDKNLKLLNGEISWLSFNNRVLQEVYDESTPLIERIKFLSIYSSNLDEFFRVRVAALIRYSEKNKFYHGDDPKKVLSVIQREVKELQINVERIYYDELIPLLAKENIYVVDNHHITDFQSGWIRNYFMENIFYDMSPVMIDKVDISVQLKDPAIYFIVVLTDSEKPKKKPAYALVEIPSNHSRFIVLPSEGEKKYVILLDDVIRHCMCDLFGMYGYNEFKPYTFKITRDAELDINTGLSISLLDSISKSLKQRKSGAFVRFTYDRNMPDKVLAYLRKKLDIKAADLIPGGRYHNFKDFMKFPNLGRKDLEFEPTPPLPRKDIDLHRSFLSVISKKNILIALPFQSFDYIIYFLREAAFDPDVESIKMTLYRLADRSKVITALKNAARNGKRVVTLVELKARFDEASNIYWTKELEGAGVKVLYGIPMFKVHSKICLVKRHRKNREEERFAMLGTGNYNENTGRQYCDYHYFTANKNITSELEILFDSLESNLLTASYRTLYVSPVTFRKKIIYHIDREIENAKKGIDSYIIMKMNALTDEQTIYKLYEAGKAGVKIQLIVRGMCRLIPEKKGLSENISVISIVDKYLEHARVYIFSNNNKEKIYLGSADIMPRNIDHRVEVTFPILDKESKKIIRDMIDLQLSDNVKARLIDETYSNSYKRPLHPDEPKVRSQLAIYDYFRTRQ